MRLKPFHNRVVCRALLPGEKLGSLYLPQTVQGRVRPTRGIVLAVNRSVEDIEVGDVVFWPKNAGTFDRTNEDEPLMFLTGSEILGSIAGPSSQAADSGTPRRWDYWVDLPGDSHVSPIITPEGFRHHKLSILGTIRAVGEGWAEQPDLLQPGTKVLLAAVPVRRIPLGEDDEGDATFAVRREEMLGSFEEGSEVPDQVFAGETYELGRYPLEMDPEALVQALRATEGEVLG